MKTANLSDKGKIGALEIQNRIVMPPIGVSVGDGSGYISERDIAYYEARAKGGIGMIVSACCSVTSELCGNVSTSDPNLSLPGSAEKIKPLMERIHKHGTKMIFQLLHMGRQANTQINNGQQAVAPSALKEVDYLEVPRELTKSEIKQLVDAYVKAAQTAMEGGADGVELHGAHGYLIHQFMSPRANKRTDEYGGSFENRMRFVTEIVEGIKTIRPRNTIISIRMNAKDGFDGGLTLEEGVQIAKHMEKIGIDCINISHGTYTNAFVITEPSLFPEGCRTEQVKAIKDAVTIPVVAVNNIKRAETADKLIADGVCDFIGLARGSLCDPAFGSKVMADKPETIRTCIGCDNCLDFASTSGHSRCSLNPYLGEEYQYNDDTLVKSGIGKNAVVIGGGPGGMNAAELLSQKGFRVILFDQNTELGGALLLACKGAGKDKIRWTIDGYKARLAETKVEVRLNTTIKSAADIKQYNPSVVVAAIGGKPTVPAVPGIDLPHVKLAHDILKDFSGIRNRSIAIVGSGMTGLETAEVLVENNNKIRMYDMLDEIAKGAETTNKIADMGFLTEHGVTFHPNCKMKEILPDGVVLENVETGEAITDKADMVILSLGIKSDKTLENLAKEFEKVVYVGDCVTPGKIVNATGGSFDELWNL